MPPIPHLVRVRHHPGSSAQNIQDEPDWSSGGHEHRVGFRNRQNRVPGLTHSGDERDEDSDPYDEVEAAEKYRRFRERVEAGELVNFRDVVNAQEDYHLRRPEVHSRGWRYVLGVKEDWVRNEEEWPANVEKRRKEEDAKREKEKEKEKEEGYVKEKDKQIDDGKGEKESKGENESVQQEHEWKRENGGGSKHHNAYPADAEDSSGDDVEKSEYEKLREKYSPQEIALLQSLRHEKEYICNLSQNDGKRTSPVSHADPLVSIDEADQFSPDNWIPRSSNLIRLTGKVSSTRTWMKSTGRQAELLIASA